MCKNCLEYGHPKRVCQAVPICLNCTSPEHDEPSCNNEKKCLHCIFPHRTGDKNCQQYKMEAEILVIQARSRVSRTQAKIIFERERPNIQNMNYAAAVATTSAGPTIPLVGVKQKIPTQAKGPDPEITRQPLQHDYKQTASPIAQTITPTNNFKIPTTTDEATMNYDDYHGSRSRKRSLSSPQKEPVHKGRKTSSQRSSSRNRNEADNSRPPKDRHPRSPSHSSGKDRHRSSSRRGSVDRLSTPRDGHMGPSRDETERSVGVTEDPRFKLPPESPPKSETMKENPKSKSLKNKNKNPSNKKKSSRDEKSKGKHGRNER